jgi:SAM-dependent methyltransferase
MMNRSCPACGASSTLAFEAFDENRRITEDAFEYFRCERCSLVFLDPVPDDLGPFYAGDYYSIPKSSRWLSLASLLERYKLGIVRRFKQSGRLLEIGPSWGQFAYLAKNAGFTVDAIEYDAECCRFLRDVAGIQAFNSGEPHAALRDLGPYDVIAMWHSFEHLPDAWKTLEVAAERLAPGGILVIAAPNPDAFQLRMLGPHWTHIDAPRHLYLVPASTLVARAAASGLSPVLVTTRDKGSRGWNHFGWRVSLRNRFRGRFARTVAFLVGGVVAVGMMPFDLARGKGSAFTVVLRKDPAP